MESCSNCKFFMAQGDLQGLCRRYPPVIQHYANGNVAVEFPPMLNAGWCGEFKQLETDECLVTHA